MKVLQFPLAKVTLLFLTGILTAHFMQPKPMLVFIFTAACALTLAWLGLLCNKNRQFLTSFGIGALIFSYAIGLLTVSIHEVSLRQNNYIHQINAIDSSHELKITLRERLRSSTKNDRYLAVVRQIDEQESSGRILVNFRRSAIDTVFQIGTNLKVKGKVILPKKPNNPDQFDYGRYLANKSILAQLYVNQETLQINKSYTKDLFYYSDALRQKILRNLKAAHFPDAELAVVAALILGQQQDIAPEVLQDYQYAGAIHILSVSGLHVGFIVLFLNFILNYLPKNKFTSHLKLAVLLAALWGFAILAGLSPSVIRSATMFSFVSVGMNLRRKTNVFHTLLVSLLLILLFEPSFLFDVGFQLSYLALFFILWLQPILSDWYTPKNKILNYFWQIVTVSFAAQTGTLPLSLYYFHQFPGLFFVTNLVVIPLVSIIMAVGVVAMILAALNYTPMLLTVPLLWCIRMLNTIISEIASFEQFLFKDIPFNIFMQLALYMLIVAVVLWFGKSNFTRAAFALMALILFQASYFFAKWSGKAEHAWIVFNVPKSTMIIERDGEDIKVYKTGNLRQQLLQPYLTANFCKVEKILPVPNSVLYHSKKILLIDSAAAYPRNTTPDLLLLTQSPKFNLDRMLQQCKPRQIVADASNFKSYVKRWEATCTKAKIPFHATAEKGFYKLEN